MHTCTRGMAHAHARAHAHAHMHTHTHVHMHMHMHMHTRTSQVRYERDGASRELRYCDYFGEVSMLTQTSHLATATATSRVEMVEVTEPEPEL